ncbi:type IV toxin-antitoxin system AbiEi family antitoxin [Peijinzhouia sedimentorum]
MKIEIINNALENLYKAIGMEGDYSENGLLDGTLNLYIDGKKITFVIDLKNEIRPYQLDQIEKYFQNHKNFLLVANRIFPKVKEELRLKGISYLEANGNLFLKKDGSIIFIDNQKAAKPEKTKGNRAFTKTGLKVLFYLLQHKEDINLTQRELAENANVGLGNIPQVIEGLKETGFLLSLNKNEYVWENFDNLLERWITEYGTILKPKLKREKYTYEGNWKDIIFKNELTVWGGEVAADLLTQYLRPEKLCIYSKENRINLMKNYRLIPKEYGEIEVFEMFWKQEKSQKIPPAILIYADLLLEGGKRNKETAKMIYDEHIKPKL